MVTYLPLAFALLALLGACTTTGPAVIAAQQVRLPAPPASLTKPCPPAPVVTAGDDLRKTLDQTVLWGACSQAKVTTWASFYSTLRGRT